MKKSLKNALTLGMLFVVLVVLYFILKKIGFNTIYSNLIIADKKFIVLAFLSVLAGFIVWNLKWYLLVKEITKPKFWHLFLVIMAGSFVNTTTPGARVGGEPLRAYYLSREYGIEKSKFFATTIADKAINGLVFTALSIFSMIFVIFFVKIEFKFKILLAAILFVLFALAAAGVVLRKRIKFKRKYLTAISKKIYYFPMLKALRKKFKSYKDFEVYVIKKLSNIVDVLKKTMTQKKVLFRDVVLALARWFFIYLGTYFIFRAFGYEISFLAIVVVITLSVFIGSLIALPGGMGFIETAMIGLYLAFGINTGIAATVSIIDRFIFYVCALAIGGICFAYLSLRYK